MVSLRISYLVNLLYSKYSVIPFHGFAMYGKSEDILFSEFAI